MKIFNLVLGFTTIFILSGVVLFGCEKSTSSRDSGVTISADSVVINDTGEAEKLHIAASGEWQINTNAEWLIVSEANGTGNAEILLSAEENASEDARSSSISIIANNDTKEVKVIQLGVDKWGGYTFLKEPNKSDMRSLTMPILTSEMGAGWNLGNSLEAIGGETAWGNPATTQQLIDSVKATGFNMIRIPVAWSVFSDEANYIIDEAWMQRVEEVVNYVLDNDMYAMINIHWDGGWMQPIYESQNEVNFRLENMWKQIAIHFRDYNDYLLFAGTNEVHVEGEWGAPSDENTEVQNKFNDIFLNTVRKTGGRNAYRYLVIQSYNTNIDHGVNFAQIPEDIVEGKLLMEVHYYDPYNFALNENSNITQWGNNAEDDTKVESWANESFVDTQFNKVKTNFGNKGIGVILGEYGAISRPDVEGHETYREYYIEYVTSSAVKHGIVPVYWDNGHAGEHGFALFNRSSGEQVTPRLVNSIMKAFE